MPGRRHRALGLAGHVGPATSHHLTKERADVFANPLLDADIEAGFGGHFKGIAGLVIPGCRLPVEFHRAFAGYDFHALRLVGSKVEAPGINQAQGFLAAVREVQTVADNLAVKINICFRHGGDAAEFRGEGGHNAASLGARRKKSRIGVLS